MSPAHIPRKHCREAKPERFTLVRLVLNVERTPKYPEEAPIIDIEQEEGSLEEEDIEDLRKGLALEVSCILLV